MRSFKALMVSVFSCTLLLFSNGVWAQDELLDTNPSFYFLQDEGETFKVHTCHGIYSENALQSIVQGRNPIGAVCSSVTEVFREDLNRFAIKLALELESLNLDNDAKKNVAGFSGAVSGLLLMSATLPDFGDVVYHFRNYGLRGISSLKSEMIKMGAAVVLVLGGMILLNDSFKKREYGKVRSYLHQGLLNGVVRKEGHSYDTQMMEMFADFLSEYGAPINS